MLVASGLMEFNGSYWVIYERYPPQYRGSCCDDSRVDNSVNWSIWATLCSSHHESPGPKQSFLYRITTTSTIIVAITITRPSLDNTLPIQEWSLMYLSHIRNYYAPLAFTNEHKAHKRPIAWCLVARKRGFRDVQAAAGDGAAGSWQTEKST